jgi:hypothetical protein
VTLTGGRKIKFRKPSLCTQKWPCDIPLSHGRLFTCSFHNTYHVIRLSLYIKLREYVLNTRNTCCHSAQNILSSRLLSKNIQFKIYSTTTSPVFVWVWNWVSHIKGKAQIKGYLRIWYWGEEYLDMREGCNRKIEKMLHNLYSSPNIIRMFKLKRLCWAEHVARMGEKRILFKISIGKIWRE